MKLLRGPRPAVHGPLPHLLLLLPSRGALGAAQRRAAGRSFATTTPSTGTASTRRVTPATQWLNRLLYLDIKTFLPCLNLAYTDRMSMAASTEVRVPLLDDELVELAGRVPPTLKLRRTTRKYVLKKAMEGVLPEEVIWRPKAGFGAPLRAWIDEDLRPARRRLPLPGRRPRARAVRARRPSRAWSATTRPGRPTTLSGSGRSWYSSCGSGPSSTDARLPDRRPAAEARAGLLRSLVRTLPQ